LLAESDNDGGAALTVSATEIASGLFVASDAETVIVPACGPVESPEGFTETVRRLDDEATVSHGMFDVADQVKVPPPEFVTLTVCAAGAALPMV